MSELVILKHKIEVSQRIIDREALDDEDPIVHHMIVEELKKQVPDLERRVRRLTFKGPDRRRS